MLQLMLSLSIKQPSQLYLPILTGLLNHQHCKIPLSHSSCYSALIILFAFKVTSRFNENVETFLIKRKTAYFVLFILLYSKTAASCPEGMDEVGIWYY